MVKSGSVNCHTARTSLPPLESYEGSPVVRQACQKDRLAVEGKADLARPPDMDTRVAAETGRLGSPVEENFSGLRKGHKSTQQAGCYHMLGRPAPEDSRSLTQWVLCHT